jgi:hypothetical protein
MTDDETLARAMQSLRDVADGSDESAARTRTEILARAGRARRRRRGVAFMALPVAAAFFTTAAWGALTGRWRGWIEIVAGHATERRPAPPETTLPVPPEPVRALPIVIPESTTEVLAPLVLGTERGSASEKAPAPRASSPATAPVTSDRQQSLYATAHRAHFVEQDAAGALRGWDAYLAAYPGGRFALEARYNRAISLVRLGRREEAASALSPFARGENGGYRQSEARALLDALK